MKKDTLKRFMEKSKFEKVIIGALLSMTLCCALLVGTVIKQKVDAYNENKAFSTSMSKMFAEIDNEVAAKNNNSAAKNTNYKIQTLSTNSTNYSIQNLSTYTSTSNDSDTNTSNDSDTTTSSDSQYKLIMQYAYIRVYLHYQGDVRTVEVWKNIVGEWEYHGGYTLRN